MLANGSQLVRQVWFSSLEPEPLLTVSEWSDQNRVLSRAASAEPGPWRTSRTPYLKEPMDCLSSYDPTEEVTVMKGSQTGFSEAGCNWIGYVISHAPGPMMVVQPTDQMAKRFSNQRIKQMIQTSKEVRTKVSAFKSRDAGNTMLMKEFNGGILLLVGANSATGLSSVPIRYIMLDEIDRYPEDIPGEGDPVALAEARARTFGKRKKVLRISTPTTDKQSKILYHWNRSDKRYFMVPCPHCGHFQALRWPQIRFDKSNPATAKYECEDCHALIDESEKTKMLEAGKWEPTNKEATPRHAGFHLSSLYSPVGWYSWEQAVSEFLSAKKSEVTLRVFVNTVLGEPWKQKGEAPEWEKLYNRRELYPFNTLPKQAPFITAGVDVQKNRLEVEIVAWGPNFESWSLDYRSFEGDTSQPGVYQKLDELLQEKFYTEDKSGFANISGLAIDTGYNTHSVYAWVRGKGQHIIPIKGNESSVVLVNRPNFVDVNVEGLTIRRGLALWTIGVSVAKNEIYGWLGQTKPKEGEPVHHGFCHFPQYDEEYFKMLTAEQVVKKIVRGYPRYVWEKVRERNEALDARVYARVAAYILGMDKFDDAHWASLRDSLKKDVQTPKNQEKITEKNGVRFKKSEYWD